MHKAASRQGKGAGGFSPSESSSETAIGGCRDRSAGIDRQLEGPSESAVRAGLRQPDGCQPPGGREAGPPDPTRVAPEDLHRERPPPGGADREGGALPIRRGGPARRPLPWQGPTAGPTASAEAPGLCPRPGRARRPCPDPTRGALGRGQGHD